jgi:uncharacterized 2Fe-2S/4Fe-4S cluster protein (DUF4445 family)
MSHRPFVFFYDIDLSPPSVQDKTADADRLSAELIKKGLHDVIIPLDILRKLPAELRRNRFRLRLVIGFCGNTFKVLGLTKEKIYGLALDIGSTNIECSLFDLDTGKKIDSIAGENPQIKFGSDVLSRVQHVIAGSIDNLADELLQGVNLLIKAICRDNNISPEDILRWQAILS